MKTQDLIDYKIMMTTSGAAFNFYTELLEKEQLGEFYHRYLDWTNPKDSTKDIVCNIATILMDENFFHTYLKYAN